MPSVAPAERLRLADLQSYEVLDTPPEDVYDRLTRLAAAIFETPLATMTLIDERRQWFKSTVGTDVRETDRTHAFCAVCISANRTLVVPDATRDPVFADNPYVTGPPHIRFYAGVPLISVAGHALGTLSVMDVRPREITALQRETLEVLARQAMLELEQRRQSLPGSERVRADRELQRIKRAQRMLRACSEALVRGDDEAALLQTICRICVETGGYRMAWVGYAQDDEERSVRPMARAGEATEYLREARPSWSADTAYGRGAIGTSIREGRTMVITDMLQHAEGKPWVPRAVAHGFRGAICLPLRDGGRSFGGLCLYQGEVSPIGADEIKLLEALADDLVFGIGHLRAREQQRQADAQIRRQASLLDQAQDAIIVCGIDHRVLYWNRGAERLYGWRADEAMGRSIVGLLYEEPAAFLEAAAAVLARDEWRGEIVQRCQDGSQLPVEGHWTLVRDEGGQPQSILAINTDITQRKAAERRIHTLAFYDLLTGLPNRLMLADQLEQALATSAHSGIGGALLFIDLDHFKTLNETVGHERGDRMLEQVAARLTANLRGLDTVARFGGDEFVVMLEAMSEDREEVVAQARAVGEKLLAALSLPYHLGELVHQATASIGIAVFGSQGESVGELLKQADIAMYQAKGAGRNTLRFFDPGLQAALKARAALEVDLRQALTEQQLLLHYQPQADAEGRVSGAEALVRWRHPERGLVSPAEFIPLAEETGLIVPLGRLVLREACALLAGWAAGALTRGLDMSVNVSASQFRHPDFVSQVVEELERSGADPRRLKIELTESLMVDDMDVTIAKMDMLRALGVRFSLDDFGTGYSSLSYLKRLPLDQLKIDQSFVRDIMADPNDTAIVQTIIALARSLGLGVIAEGVETDAQRAFLAHHGCGAYQGYLFSRPLPAEQLGLFISERTQLLPE